MLSERAHSAGIRPTTILSAGVAVLAAAFLASCSSSDGPGRPKFTEREYGVPASPRMVSYGRPVPKGGGRYMVGKPYKVAGKTYVPRAYTNYSKVGLASWYGRDFHGRRTANGEVFDANDLSAAHPTMPLPSYARVTNLANGRSVVVRVNDRGPYSRSRIVDVSATTAAMLDFKRAGTARVKVDYIGPARMDGLDKQMLLATYRAPGVPANDTMLAWNTPAAPTRVAAASTSRSRPAAGYDGYADAPIMPGAPMVLAPSFTPAAMTDEDPLGPLIMRTGLASSYVDAGSLSPAQKAAAALAKRSSLEAALERAAARKAEEIAGSTVVLLGVFSNRDNANRIGSNFSRFGQIEIAEFVSDGKTLRSVRVLVSAAGAKPADVVSAATAAGLRGVRIVPR